MVRSRRFRSLGGRVPLAVAALATGVLMLGGGSAGATGGAGALPRASANVARVNALVHAMTLDEKIALLTGAPGAGTPDPSPVGQAGFVPGVPRLGIPALRF